MSVDLSIENIINDYLADQQDGFVSNIDSYVDEKYKNLSESERLCIKILINNRIKCDSQL